MSSMSAAAVYWVECSNCEGEGRVVIWGFHGHEVPVSRMIQYPDDRPFKSTDQAGIPRTCDCCRGTGRRPEDGIWP